MTMIPESGGVAMKAGRRVAESGRRGDGVVAPRDRFSVETHGMRGYTLLVGHDHVVRRLEELDEQESINAVNGAAPLSLDLSSPVGMRFRSALNFVWGQLASSGMVRPPDLLVAALEEVLLNGFMLLLSPDGKSRGIRRWRIRDVAWCTRPARSCARGSRSRCGPARSPARSASARAICRPGFAAMSARPLRHSSPTADSIWRDASWNKAGRARA